MTTTRNPGAPTWPRLLTAADLAQMPTSLPDGDVRYELNDGVLVIMAPAGGEHAFKQSNVLRYLIIEGQLKGSGRPGGEGGIVLRRKPDRVVEPDAFFFTKDQLPVRYSREGYLETIPKLVVEIRSKNDTLPEIESKVAEYLAAGVVEVWVLDPDVKTIAKHTTGGVVVLSANEALTSDLLPGFSVPVHLFFAE
jgi:Uma2 family endonuclease